MIDGARDISDDASIVNTGANPALGAHGKSNDQLVDERCDDADQVQIEEEQADDDEEDELNFGLEVEDDDDMFIKDACKPMVESPPQEPADHIQTTIALSGVPDWVLSGVDEEEYNEHMKAEEQLRNLKIGGENADGKNTSNSQTIEDREGPGPETQPSGNVREEPCCEPNPETIRLDNEHTDRAIRASLETARREEALQTLGTNAESAGNSDTGETRKTSGGTAGENRLPSTSYTAQEQEIQKSDGIKAGNFTAPRDGNGHIEAQYEQGPGAEDHEDPAQNSKPESAKKQRKYWKETGKKKGKKHPKASSKKSAKKDAAIANLNKQDGSNIAPSPGANEQPTQVGQASVQATAQGSEPSSGIQTDTVGVVGASATQEDGCELTQADGVAHESDTVETDSVEAEENVEDDGPEKSESI